MATTKTPLFPRTIAEQISDLHTKNDYLNLIAARPGIDIPGAEITVMAQLVTAVDTAHAATLNADTRTKLDTATQTQTILDAQKHFRKVIEFYVAGNSAATPTDYEMLRIPQDGPHPHLPAPTHSPGIGHITSYDNTVSIPFFDVLTGKTAKPRGVHEIEIYYKLGGEPPTEIGGLTERAVATASPLQLPFDPSAEFKPLYLAFRWIGTRGDYGPWSEIYRTVVTR